MKIIGDIGNTEVKICLVDDASKIKKKVSIKTNEINKNKIKVKLKYFKNKKNKIKNIVFSSVVPKIYNQFSNYFNLYFDKKIVEIKNLNLNKLINIKVNKKQVGSDRLANSIALINPKKNFIIIDFGTATTFDVIIKDTYKGGVIAPGIRISLNTLSDKATLIPKINLKKIKNIIGIDTVTAVRSGFFWGYAGLIDNIVNLIKKETNKSFKVVITGGFSNLFKKSIKTKVVLNKEITVKGLIKISELMK